MNADFLDALKQIEKEKDIPMQTLIETIEAAIASAYKKAFSEVAEIRQVRTLPVLLGAFLAVLAVGAVGHALATAVRRRSRDLAVLRAVGMTQWQCRWVVITHGIVAAQGPSRR